VLLLFSVGDFAAATELATEILASYDGLVGHDAAVVETYRGLLAHQLGDFAGAELWYTRGLRDWASIGQPLGEARCHLELALLAVVMGDWERAGSEFDLADAICARERNADGQARLYVDRGLAALIRLDVPRALLLLGEAVEQTRGQLYDAKHATARCYLGLAQLFADDLNGARANLRAALTLFNDAGARLLLSYCLFGLAGVASASGQPLRAAALCGATFALQDRLGMSMAPMVRQLYELGETKIRAQLDEATYSAAFERGRELNDVETIAIALDDARA
jgi:tetratricopeptide (TPR) repeat protein